MEDALLSLLPALWDWIVEDPNRAAWAFPIAALIALGVKVWLKAPTPIDPWWKRVLWALASLGDKASLNSEPVSSIRKRTSSAPPPRTSVPPGGVTMLALSLLLSGCQGCTVRQQAQLADPTDELFDAAASLIEQEARADLAQAQAPCGEEPLCKAEAERRLREHYAPVEGAYAAARAVQGAWVEAIQRAHGGGEPVPLGLAAQLLSRYAELLGAAENVLGLKLPSPPDVLKALAGGVR